MLYLPATLTVFFAGASEGVFGVTGPLGVVGVFGVAGTVAFPAVLGVSCAALFGAGRGATSLGTGAFKDKIFDCYYAYQILLG